MTDNRFVKLVNLYLDKEIDPAGLSELKAEIDKNPEHRKSFEHLCRMHAASRKALIGQSSQSGVNQFLRKEVSEVQSKCDQRSRLEHRLTPEAAEAKARKLLATTVAASLFILLAASVTAAYLIDRAAERVSLQAEMATLPDDIDSIDLSALQLPGEFASFMEQEYAENGNRITEVLVVKLKSQPLTGGTMTHTVAFPIGVAGVRNLSIMELHQRDTYLKRCQYQLPGTSTPVIFSKQRPPLLTEADTLPLP